MPAFDVLDICLFLMVVRPLKLSCFETVMKRDPPAFSLCVSLTLASFAPTARSRRDFSAVV